MARRLPTPCLAVLVPLASALLALPATAAAKPKLVQKGCAAIDSGASAALEFKRPNEPGNLIVAYVVWDGGSGAAVSDTTGNAYQSAVGPTQSGAGRAQLFYAANVAAGRNELTSSFGAGVGSRGVLCAYEYSGVARTDPLRATLAASGSADAIESGELAAGAGELLFVAVGTDGTGIAKLKPRWRTRIHKHGTRTADRVVKEAGLYGATARQQSGTAWVMQMAAFEPQPSSRFPLKVSANRRYLVDRTKAPFLITGDSPQAVFIALSEEEADAFFANRRAAGFNTVWINLLAGTSMGGRQDASTYDGIRPFHTPGDLSTPNDAYFARVDRMLGLAAEHGLLVFLDPAETIDFLSVLRSNGVAKARAYGRFLGARYRRFDNIVWMSGNDFQTWEDPDDDALVLAVARGIRERDGRHMHTALLSFTDSSTRDDPRWEPLIKLNTVYSYQPTYAKVLEEHARKGPKPIVLGEANYEFEHNWFDQGTPGILRRQAYWALLSGAAGHFYGNGYTWHFLPGWQGQLDTPGSAQMGLVKDVFEPRAWHKLVPDPDHRVVTSGVGTFTECCTLGDSDYLTAARTRDGKLVMAYMPTIREITVDMSKLAAPAHASWYDPTSGEYSPIAGSPLANTGSREFSPPGSNDAGDGDWLLILETRALVPGT